MDEVITERVRFSNKTNETNETNEEVASAIREFLGVDILPELDNKPRILIAAGTIDDQELTATVLWLRDFGLDIGCVELTPYKITEPDRFVLVPRVIIPLPEAKQHLVGVQKKEVAKQVNVGLSSPNNSALWRSVADAFRPIAPNGFSAAGKARAWFMQIITVPPFADVPHFTPDLVGSGIHFEWLYKDATTSIVALHFETKIRTENKRIFEEVLAHSADIAAGISYEFGQGNWNRKWRDLRFVITHPADEPVDDTADRLANCMKTFIERATPIIRQAISNTPALPPDA